MSRLLKGILATAPALAAVGLGAAPASAGYQGDPLLGDVDGDGVDDRATLSGTEAECAVHVELGDGAGGYGAPTTHTFPPMGEYASCPDMGVVVDLGGDGVSELVLGWFNGSSIWEPEPVDLLVLRDFVPAGGFEAIEQPSYIGTAHIDTDGLLDVYEWTDQGQGFRSYLNTPSGELVPGPLRSCEANEANDYQLHDLDGDGDVELVQHFADGCHTPDTWASGVAVVHADGTRQVLVAGRDVYDWDIEVRDTDGDADLDIVTTADSGVVYTHLNNGDATFANPK